MASYTIEKAQSQIEILTNALEERRENTTDAEFLLLVETYKTECKEVYERLGPIDWLVHNDVNVCGFIVRMTKIPAVIECWSLEDQSIRVIIFLVKSMLKLGETDYKGIVSGKKFSIHISKIPKMKQVYKICVHCEELKTHS